MAAARNALDAFKQDVTGSVTVSGFHSAGQALFGPLPRELSTSQPAPTVHLTDEDVAQSDFPALTARYDLVLAHRMDHSTPWPSSGIRSLTLVREPLDVAVAATHPFASRRSLSPADVAGESWVTSVDDRDIVRLPLRGVNTLRAIDVLARPEHLRRRSVRQVIETCSG